MLDVRHYTAELCTYSTPASVVAFSSATIQINYKSVRSNGHVLREFPVGNLSEEKYIATCRCRLALASLGVGLNILRDTIHAFGLTVKDADDRVSKSKNANSGPRGSDFRS